jgi:hypothetical protein
MYLCSAPIIIYGYVPSLILAIVAAAFFAITFIAHAYQTFRYRTWYFVTLPIALLLEVVGYIARTLSARRPYFVLYFVLQYFFIVTAPVFISAGIYAVLSVLIKRVGREYSPVLGPRWILAIFVTSDVICTCVQIAGAALIGVASSNDQDPTRGNNILLIGLAVQVLVFFIFIVLLGFFLFKARSVILRAGRNMKLFLMVLVAATLLVYLRTCFRLAETALGLDSFLFRNEHYFAALEFVPIAVAVVLFNFRHPGQCLRKDIEVVRSDI